MTRPVFQPAKLLAAGYPFHFPELEQAVRHERDRLNADLASSVREEQR